MTDANELQARDVEFWDLKKVLQTAGLSRSEIYRRMRAEPPTFPRSHAYRNSTRRFWRSDEVRTWQVAEIMPDAGDEMSLVG